MLIMCSVVFVLCLVVLFMFSLTSVCWFFFFFSSRRRHTRSLCDWSSDVCSSDLTPRGEAARFALQRRADPSLSALPCAIESASRPPAASLCRRARPHRRAEGYAPAARSAGSLHAGPCVEIGRASCRERG